MPKPIFNACALALVIALAAAARAQPPAPTTTPEPAAAAPAPAPVLAGAAVGDRNARPSDRTPPEQHQLLKAGADEFDGRYIADLTPEHRGAVIVLPDSGQHESWPRSVAALLDDLPQHGWSALAIELPAPAQEAGTTSAPQPPAPADPAAPPPAPAGPPAPATPALSTGAEEGIEKQAQARIDAALTKIRELNGGQPQPTVLIGFGSGAWRAAESLRRHAASGAEQPLQALVMIDARQRLPAAKVELPVLLPLTELPALDVTQSSATLVRADAEARRRAVLRQKERVYHQLVLPPLNASEPTEQTVLVKRIRSWLQRHVEAPPETKTDRLKP